MVGLRQNRVGSGSAVAGYLEGDMKSGDRGRHRSSRQEHFLNGFIKQELHHVRETRDFTDERIEEVRQQILKLYRSLEAVERYDLRGKTCVKFFQAQIDQIILSLEDWLVQREGRN